MKIGFAIAGQFLVYDLDGIKSTDSWAYDEEFYYLIKNLEKNKLFENEVIKLRIKMKLPKNGIDFGEYNSFDYEYRNEFDHEKGYKNIIKNYENWLNKINKEGLRICNKLNIPIQIHQYIKEIIIAGFVYSTRLKFSIDYDYFWNDKNKFSHSIMKLLILQKCSKKELIEYINSIWPTLEKYNHLEGLPSKTNYFVSKRDVRIFELKQKKYKHREVVDKILEEFKVDNNEGKVNEGSVKQAYSRAKKKILFEDKK